MRVVAASMTDSSIEDQFDWSAYDHHVDPEAHHNITEEAQRAYEKYMPKHAENARMW